jgi:hypothetical protein
LISVLIKFRFADKVSDWTAKWQAEGKTND